MILRANKKVNCVGNDQLISTLIRTKAVRDERLPMTRIIPISHIGLVEKNGVEYVFYVPHFSEIGQHGNEYVSVNKIKLDANDDIGVVTTEIVGGLLMFNKAGGLVPAILNHNSVKFGARITAVIPIYDEDGFALNNETFIWGGENA